MLAKYLIYRFHMTIRHVIRKIPWSQVRDQLYGAGFSSLGTLLDEGTCNAISGWYDNDNLFRSRIEMARYRFGKGEYKYFAYPLPGIVAELREALYRQRGNHYDGGELVLVEQRPRAQNTPHVIVPQHGEAIAITTRHRPVKRGRGFYRANVRHGVSALHTGSRHTLGILFHDAK